MVAVNSDDFVTVFDLQRRYMSRCGDSEPQTTFDYAGKDADDRGDPTTSIGEGGAAGQIPQD